MHFSWLEPKSPAEINEARDKSELRIRADFVHAGMDDAARMAFVGMPIGNHGQAAVARP